MQEEQCGFREGRSTTDQHFTLHLERHWEYAKEIYMCFVDLEKAYDRVLRGKLWGVLQEYGIDGQILWAIRSLYSDCRSCVRVSGMSSDSFPVPVGLRQGCVLSPFLFLVYMDRICRRSLGPKGVNISDVTV